VTAAPRLTACVITLDEEAEIGDCLASIAFCDEIVVVDSGSADRTREIALAAGARVVQQPWLGFAAQRNVALDHARGEWVLEIDADERVTPELARSIQTFVDQPPPDVALAALPRRQVILHHPLGPSAKYPEYCHRLFVRGSYRHDETFTVHEAVIPAGRVAPLEGDLTHALATSWGQFVGDGIRYARLEARQFGKRKSLRNRLLGAVLRPLLKGGWRLVVDGGWRDGVWGLAMIGRDCLTDSLVWLLPTSPDAPARVAGQSAHYGSRRWPIGPPHVIALAYGRRAAADAATWAGRARTAGLDVTLIARPPATTPGVRTQPLGSRGPLTLLRAVDLEERVRTIDAVVCFGTYTQRMARLLPDALRGLVTPLAAAPDPDTLAEIVARARGAS
jgi:hypothetical protein